MRVVSYNIRKAVGLDWRRDAARIIDVLAEIDADMVVLQEADKRIGKRAGVLPADEMRERLGYEVAEVSVRPASHGWHGNAILYRSATAPVSQTNRIDLPSIEPRGAVSVLVENPQVEVIGVHLGLTRRNRESQLRTLGDYVGTVRHPVLIAGDFNIWQRDRDISAVMGLPCDVVLPGDSFHAARPVAPLDRFVLSGRVGCAKAWVHHSDLAARASDHLPIVIDLDFAGLTGQ